MKKIRVVTVLLMFIWIPGAFAGFKITKNIYRIQQLQEAQDEARAKNKAICILYTDADSTCPLSTQASLDVIDALDGKTIVVYVNAVNEQEQGLIPPKVQQALDSPECGNVIPETVVVDPDLNEILAMIPYASDKERKERLSKAKGAVSAWQQTKAKTSAGMSVVSRVESPAVRIWTSASGKTMEGRFSKLQQDIVFLTIPDGTMVQIPINKLCSADQIAARQLSTPRLK